MCVVFSRLLCMYDVAAAIHVVIRSEQERERERERMGIWGKEK